jgi:hypothetical protein
MPSGPVHELKVTEVMDPKSVPECATPDAGSVTEVSEDLQVTAPALVSSVSVTFPAAPAVTPLRAKPGAGHRG